MFSIEISDFVPSSLISNNPHKPKYLSILSFFSYFIKHINSFTCAIFPYNKMKLLYFILTLGACSCYTAQAYVTGSSPLGKAEWLKNTGAKSTFAPPPVNKDVNDIFLEEYHSWANRYGKSTSDLDRFEIFKVNFLLQMQHNKKTGTFRHLNEYGDSKYCSERTIWNDVPTSTTSH